MPNFYVWEKSEPENRILYNAANAKEAALVWAEDDDINSVEYAIASGKNAQVLVLCPDGSVVGFEVHGEAVPTYYAYPTPKEGE